MYIKSSIKLSRGLFISNSSGRGGGDGDRAYLRMGGLFNLEKTMVSVLHKELEYKVEVGGHAANLNFRLVYSR